MGLLALAAVVVLLFILYISLYNKLKRLSVKVEEGSAGIDVALEKRYDMLSEEIEAVKKFLQHEQQIYAGVTAVRAGKELDEAVFREKKELTEEAARTIGETIREQQEQMRQIRQQLDRQRSQSGTGDEGGTGTGVQDRLDGQQTSLDRKLGLLTSVQQGLSGVTSSVNALAEQYPTLYSYASIERFQRDIFDTEEHLQAAFPLRKCSV